MITPLICLAAAVTLALYAFYCAWEGGRADLAANFRHMVPGLPGHPIRVAGDKYRLRAWCAGLGSALLALASLASVV